MHWSGIPTCSNIDGLIGLLQEPTCCLLQSFSRELRGNLADMSFSDTNDMSFADADDIYSDDDGARGSRP